MTSKNIEARLMKERTFRRKAGDVPYPVAYSNNMVNYDIWDNMFFKTCCRSHTMNQFETPPPVVLDLGCGGGFWAIEAARQWPSSTIYGYDIGTMQPNLSRFEQYKDIAHRVKWVRGNLLDGLEFPSSHFDFVRIVNIGLGVPEDEWQSVLEEVARVMKPGAVIEVIEEDPIFPCIKPAPLVVHDKPCLPPIIIDLPLSNSTFSSIYYSKSSSTLTSDLWSPTLSPSDRFELPLPTSSKSTSSLASSMSPTLSPRSPYSPAPQSCPSSRTSIESQVDPVSDPRDHSRLETAWEAMLSTRFLATKPLAVLPFYLSSSFENVQIHPTLNILLPPNSGGQGSALLTQRSSLDSISSGWVTTGSISDSKSCPSNISALSETSPDDVECPFNSSWTTMHLARTVRTVSGCKEAIWAEYEKLYSNNVFLVIRFGQTEPTMSSPREGFEADWSCWQNDMADRIGMRGSVMTQFGWVEPIGERPDWRVWRTNLEKLKLTLDNRTSSESTESTGPRVEFCRSMRGFVAWKS